MDPEYRNRVDDPPDPPSDPPLARRFLNDTRFAWIWVAARLYLGVVWITWGIGLFIGGSQISPADASSTAPILFASAPAQFALLLPHVVGICAITVGALLVVGAYTGATSFVSIILGMNAWYPGPTSADPVATVLAMLLVLAWRVAGWYGADRWLLGGPGVPRLVSVIRVTARDEALATQEPNRRANLQLRRILSRVVHPTPRLGLRRFTVFGGQTSISRKVTTSLALLLMLVTAQAIITMVLLTNAVDGSAELVSPALERVDHLAHAEADLLRLHTVEYSIVWTTDVSLRLQDVTQSTQLRSEIQQHIDAYGALPLDQAREQSLQQFQHDYQAYLLSEQRAFETASLGDRPGALSQYMSYHPQFQRLDDELHQMRHKEYQATENLRDHLVQTVDWARWPLGIIVLLAAAAEIVIGYHLAKSLGQGLAVLEDGTRRIANENFVEPVPIPPERELATLAKSLNSVMVTLATNKVERRRLEEERIRHTKERLNQVVQAQEAERARISRELHDQAGQAVTALHYGLTRVQHLSPDARMNSEVEQLVRLSEQAGQQISTLARELRPSVLDHLGLVPAVRGYIREYSDRIGIPVQLVTTGRIPRLSADAETALFRVIQEALTNVAKHANAQHAQVTIEIGEDQLDIVVSDDGHGFDPDRASDGEQERHGQRPRLGLLGMRERVQLLGGKIQLDSLPGHGTRLRASIPLAGNLAAPQTTKTGLLDSIVTSR